MVFAGRWLGPRIGFELVTELVNFDRNVGVTGWRLRLDARVQHAVRACGHVPHAGRRAAPDDYWLDKARSRPAADSTPSRGLPIESVDTGMKFERDVGHETDWVQTLEPRMLYVRVPFATRARCPCSTRSCRTSI